VEYALAAVGNDTGHLIGTWRLAYAPISAAPPGTVGKLGDTAHFGCAIAAPVWRKGYGAEGTSLLLSLAFDDLGIARVRGARGPENEASAAILEHTAWDQARR
jgi:[ribosomal protein S5]-alanine N-acetyltransferase